LRNSNPIFLGRAVRFCACVREISKQSQVSPKARHTRHLLPLKKSCCEELLHFYAQQNARHCSRAHTATTSHPGTLALQPPHRCISTPGKIRRHSHVCIAAMSRPGTLALQPPLRHCILTPGKMPGTAAMCALPPCHAWGHWRCSRRCAAASQLLAKPQRCSHVWTTATSRLGTLVLQLPLRRCVLTPGKTPVLQPCVRRRHVTPGDIGPLHLDAPAAMRAPLPRHARGHRRCSRHCAAVT
jgi:hypothetical protein